MSRLGRPKDNIWLSFAEVVKDNKKFAECKECHAL